MTPDDLLKLPARPESEVEWEDLLVRLELMPKALRVELEHPGRAEARDMIFLGAGGARAAGSGLPREGRR